MKGVYVKKANMVSDDERRTIIEIMNGDMNIKNLKILNVKKGELILGNHWHPYGEVMYILKGGGHYIMKNIDTKEQEEFDVQEGDVVYRGPRITRAGYFTEGSILIDGACETYVSPDFNDIKDVIME